MSERGEARARKGAATCAGEGRPGDASELKRPRGGRCVAWVLAFAATIFGVAQAALPPPIAKAFRNAGIPSDGVTLVVQETGRVQPLVAHGAAKPMNPASVMKLVTTFAALELLGPDYRWKTEAFLDGTLDNGVLRGNLVLKGHGDPKITVEQWQAFMATLVSRGLLAVDGDLVLDRSFFATVVHDAGAFDGEPLKPYNVGPDALLVNFKSVKLLFAPNGAGTGTDVIAIPPFPGVKVGPPLPRLAPGDCGDWRDTVAATFVDRGATAEATFAGRYAASCGEREWWVSLLDPAAYAHAMFTTYFREAGGRFDGGWRSGQASTGKTPFATLESPPLYDVVRDVNKLSNNVMARQVFLTLATAKRAPPATTAGATDAVRAWLVSHKLRMPELVLDNGSGLSRNERISAGSLVRLLLAADASQVREEFASSLAVAAMDGTVERRFQNGNVAGQALLKTGTLEGARAIAGYVIDADGRRWALAAIVNHPNAGRAQAALDFFVQWVYLHAAETDDRRSHVGPARLSK
jgi:D-alanyl-D-alanine carboxypeptidase/D-alanyl-D-alanine-endopeptidase (penicillin-binding protein 4)